MSQFFPGSANGDPPAVSPRCHLSPHLCVPPGPTILWGLQELLEPHTPRLAEGKQESEWGCAGRQLLLAREQREREGPEASWPPCHPSEPLVAAHSPLDVPQCGQAAAQGFPLHPTALLWKGK